ncbi:hypothetical protein ACFO4P_10025 [Epilithonimonas pallida]|uniref:Right handed beta helix region n=1 Tax=Epilithonimonas pallida TaxID=373671 RepID=A0ABY1R2N0_9FLAO|nr:hypothetical protein [Epilithonimonas pallida]SMP92934.1 hypothetical protein SAMN05421679_104225 [Epilithonimonas pallida]
MIYTEDFFAIGSLYPSNDLVQLIDSYSLENVNFEKLNSSSIQEDGIIYRKKGSDLYKRVLDNNILNAKIFNPFCDGINNDASVILKMMQISSHGFIIDGQKLTYSLLTRIVTCDYSFDNFAFVNFNFKLSNNYDYITFGGWKINVNGNITFENISIDGGRGTYKIGTETWVRGEGDREIPSIEPNFGDIFFFSQFQNTSASAEINNFKAINIHAMSAITIETYGTVRIENSYFENISMKPFHIYHSINKGGRTFVSNVGIKDCGYLADYIIETLDSSSSSTPISRDESKGLPQWSYGAIVTFGEYYIENIKVENYGASAICSDRNTAFFANNIHVTNNSEKFESNNPSGAMFFEATTNAYVNNLYINISERSPRDNIFYTAPGQYVTFDSSALNIFNTNLYLNNLNIICNSDKPLLNKGIRGSFSNAKDFVKRNYNVLIDKVSIKGKFKKNPIYYGVLLEHNDFPICKVTLNNTTVEEGNFEFYVIDEVILNKINAQESNIDFIPIDNNPLSEILLENSSFKNFNTIIYYKKITFNNCSFKEDLLFNNKIFDVGINNCNISGESVFSYSEIDSKILISGGEFGRIFLNSYHAFLTNIKSHQGIRVNNSKFFTINNCHLYTAESEPVILVSNNNNFLVSGIINNNILSIKTGTPYAGYISLDPETVDKVIINNNSENYI